MQSQSSVSESVSEMEEQLFAYFDDELEDGVRVDIEAKLGADEELAAKLADLSFMRSMIVGDLEHQAERVPEARFEQIWDSFEAVLERESRLQEAAEEPPTLWQRIGALVRPMRMPIAAVAAAGVLVFVFARSAGEPGPDTAESLASNTQDEDASDAQPTTAPAQSLTAEPAPTPQPDVEPRLAAAPEQPDPESDPDVFPQPEPGEAEIRRIEFGGHSGTISQVEGTRGTTTVIWVTEDVATVDSERSL